MRKNCPRCDSQPDFNDRFCGNCGFNLQDSQQALAGTQLEMRSSDIQFSLGVVYFKNGKYDKCIETFEKILKDDPAHGEAREMLNKARSAMAGQDGVTRS